MAKKKEKAPKATKPCDKHQINYSVEMEECPYCLHEEQRAEEEAEVAAAPVAKVGGRRILAGNKIAR